MRLRTDALIAVSLLLFACGDSDGDPEEQSVRDAAADVGPPSEAKISRDAGLLPVDSGQLDARAVLDAELLPHPPADGGPGDGATQRAAALDPRGVRADRERVNLVIQANCQQQVDCGYETDAEQCEIDTAANWYFFLLGDDECVDAVLDQIGCYATVACDAVGDCAEGIGTAMNACLDEIADAGR